MTTTNSLRSILRASILSTSAAAALLFASCAGSGGKPATMTGPNGEVYEEKYISHQVTDADKAKAQSKAAVAADNAVLYVNGMGCPLCATNINMQLERVPGVKTVKVDLGSGIVTLGLLKGAEHPSPHTLGEAVEDAGFTLVKIEEK
jgi:copper chaperone CopZ